ncbi:uncharacterized protein LOC129570826, partial [Sitodiplosis mosellana]|uniref:uncharacterized protein LOC129570826 n=1 Tax=Sitodiplosis mosellana TaxID=263140 RepID=UPI0024449CC9
MTSSAHLAVRCVMQAATEEEKRFPKAAKAIKEDFYMDDCVTGTDSEQNAIQLAKDMDKIMSRAGFELRKWKSNNKNVRNAMNSDSEKAMLFKEEEDQSTILGLKWLIDEDRFTFVVKNPNDIGKITKRTIASHVAQLYDPNGYITPITIRGKILIQDLWKEKVSWDEELNEKFVDRWREFWKDIKCIESFRIDRWLSTGKEIRIQIHGFSDSSEQAYGANVYVRVESINKKVVCNLLTTKSRVAPVKTVALPRLELTAAELLARLVKDVTEQMEWPTVEQFLWIDSSVAYYWIRKEPCTLKTYVANRVASIQENTEIRCWRHIDGTDNPADLLTRGVSPSGLIDNDLWLHGPSWLLLSQSEWPASSIMQKPPEEAMDEVKVNTFTVFRDQLRIGIKGTNRNVPLLEYTSKLEKAINVISYVNRFIRIRLGQIKLKKTRKRRGEVVQGVVPPSNEEKTEAMLYLIRKSQQEHWNKEVTSIRKDGKLPEKSKLESLKPILDNEGLLRLGGRLDRSELDYEMKHPFIIPHESRLGCLIMEYAHRETDHGGVQVMMQFIRQ